MTDEIRQFVLGVLQDMNYDVEGATDETLLGEGGLELESLGTAELAMFVEETYRVKFDDEDAAGISGMTLGEFVSEVSKRAESGVGGA